MDRWLTKEEKRINVFKHFEYLDLFPYSIAAIMVCGCIYILNAFVVLSHVKY